MFTTRRLLLITAVIAVLALVARSALAGSSWAIALTAGVASMGGTMAILGILYAAAFPFSLFARASGPVHRGAPFAAGQLPPQLLRPDDPE